jgi:hypothetical protein
VIDMSVYPDLDEAPVDLATPEAKADYIARICGAWDFGIPPERETIHLFRQWRDIFDHYPLLHSAAYAAFRALYGWPAMAGGSLLMADYEAIDARWEHGDDPCVGMI